MRNFMIDVWIWNKGKHSRPTIRFQQETFPLIKIVKEQQVKIKIVGFIQIKNMKLTLII